MDGFFVDVAVVDVDVDGFVDVVIVDVDGFVDVVEVDGFVVDVFPYRRVKRFNRGKVSQLEVFAD